MLRVWKTTFMVGAILLSSAAWGEDGSADKPGAADRRAGTATGSAQAPGFGAGVERAPVAAGSGRCDQDDLESAPSRPNWTAGAATTQCGVLETDYGWLWQGMGAGVRQTAAAMSIRYGLTARMDLRWGVPAHLTQGGGGTQSLEGVSDQWLSVTCRFKEQGARVPAMALGYGFKIPTANPAKGFGTGYVDHQLAFIASRDVKRLHFDFNTVGTLAGGPYGYDGAAQYGLVLSSAATKRLTWLVETDGGAQPGTPDRYGQALLGMQWSVRPWLVVDTAYTRTYTAGAPRQQFTFGWTVSSRPRAVAAVREGVAHLLRR